MRVEKIPRKIVPVVRRLAQFGLVFAAVFMWGTAQLSPVAHAVSTVPTTMNFQGRLTNPSGSALADGTYNMTFRLYSVSTGGSAIWTEQRLVSASQGVQVANGLFSIQLGSITSIPASLFASGNLFLEVELPTPATATSASPSWTEGAMTPRNPVSTSAYSFNSETLDGIDSAAFAQVGANNTFTGTNTFKPTTNSTSSFAIQNSSGTGLLTADSINTDIYVGSSTTDATAVFLVVDSFNGTSDPTGGINGSMYYNSSMNKLRCLENSVWDNCTPAVSANTSVPAGNTVANTITETSFASTYNIPANDCFPGRIYRVTARGVYGTTTTAPTLLIKLKTGSTLLAQTGAGTALTTTANMTNMQWQLRADVVCSTAGAAGTVEAQGLFERATSTTANAPWSMVNTAAITYNTTTAQTLQISAKWNTAKAANTITLRQLIVEAVSP